MLAAPVFYFRFGQRGKVSKYWFSARFLPMKAEINNIKGGRIKLFMVQQVVIHINFILETKNEVHHSITIDVLKHYQWNLFI